MRIRDPGVPDGASLARDEKAMLRHIEHALIADRRIDPIHALAIEELREHINTGHKDVEAFSRKLRPFLTAAFMQGSLDDDFDKAACVEQIEQAVRRGHAVEPGS